MSSESLKANEAQNKPLPAFCHLHLHSEYSLVDGAIAIDKLVQKIKSMGHQAVALTDHGNMFGAIDFYRACKSQDIKPILGCEIYHSPPEAVLPLLNDDARKSLFRASNLVLLAKSIEGYHALLKIVSNGYLKGLEEIPIVPQEELQTLAHDLIALTAGTKGIFGKLVRLLQDKSKNPLAEFDEPNSETLNIHNESGAIVNAIRSYVASQQLIFGRDNFFVEISDNNLYEQRLLNPLMVAIANKLDLQIVATANSHYLEADFAKAHSVLVGIRNELTLSKIRSRLADVAFHVFDNEEMAERFIAYPEALANSLLIAARCNVKLEFDKFFLPEFELGGENINDALVRLSRKGLEERLHFLRPLYGSEFTPEKETTYWQRLEFELGVIIKMGFPGYFLIVQDFINWAKDQDIPVGPGRGSGAGSLVAYALKITDLDPIPLNLIFERFLNPERVSMPDFDVDFCQSRRDEVIGYVTNKYTSSNVAQITTFGKLKAKAALRDVGRVLEISYPRVDRIAKLIPNELEITLKKALDEEPRLLEEAENDPLIKEMIDIALKLEGLSRHVSVHAAGVVISNGPMQNFVPVYRTIESPALITQYEMKNAEKVGLVKFDFLGLKTLTVIKKAVDIIRRTKNPDFAIETINREDAKTYQAISTGHTCGIFQLESSGMQALNTKLKPSCFEDIIAVVALFRPGPLGSGMVDDFIERKHGRQEIVYPLPQLEGILKDTYGIILYQEQVQKIAAELASYSLGEADLLRRAMGKKKPEEMAKQKSRFIDGCRQNKIDEKIADDIFELMAKFADYGFNKSHSAAYGLVSYQTAYLKTHYPEQYMAAIMTCDMDNTEKLARYIEECRRLKFVVHAPDINLSNMEFDVPKPGVITFALSGIKGIGGASIVPIIENRAQKGPFRSLTELGKRINLHKVGKKTLELLNESGAFDGFGYNRSEIHAAISDLYKYSQQHHEAKSSGQTMLFAEDADEDNYECADWEEMIAHKSVDYRPMDWLLKEVKALGVFISRHPCQLFPEDTARFGRLKLKDIAKSAGKRNLAVVAFLNNIVERKTKTGKRMATFYIEDETGLVEAVMFENEFPETFPNANIMVYCQISVKKFDTQSISIRLEKIMPLETLRSESIKGITFKLTVDDQHQEKTMRILNKMVESLKSHKGNTPVRLILDYAQGSVILRPDLKISPNDSCLQTMRNLNPKNLSVTLY